MSTTEVPVLVLGGGLAGLSSAAFLAWHGVAVTLVERRSAPLRHPRARAVNPRTMELYRGIGLQRRIEAAVSHVDGPGALLVRAPNLAAPETWRRAAEAMAGDGAVSPCGWASIDQDVLEDLVRARAVELGADVRFDAEVSDLEVVPAGVVARVRSRHGNCRGDYGMQARYLVAADGHRGTVRSTLGIGSHGPGGLGDVFTFLFEADLTAALRGRRLSVAHLDQPRPGTTLLPHDGVRSWVFSTPYDAACDPSPVDLTDAECVALVHAATGVDDVVVRLLRQAGQARTLTYRIDARVSDSFRAGPVFLVGDAAHVVPPAGAFGASMGVQDAHNLAWKLAAVLNGQAGQGLLDTYDAERRPVADLTLGQALHQRSLRGGPATGLTSGPAVPPLDYDSVVFGYRYRSRAVIEPAPPEAAGVVDPYELRADPGTRAPHAVLAGTPSSTLDLFGRDPLPVLVIGPDDRGWRPAAATLAGRFPVRVHQLGRELPDASGEILRRYALGAGGAILVRPDGFVAWRSASTPDPRPGPDPAGDAGPRDVLERALARILDRSPPA